MGYTMGNVISTEVVATPHKKTETTVKGRIELTFRGILEGSRGRIMGSVSVTMCVGRAEARA